MSEKPLDKAKERAGEKAGERSSEDRRESQTRGEIHCSFYLGSVEFALRVSSVQEVVNAPEQYLNMPLAPDYVFGLYNLRGMIIPVMNLNVLLGVEPSSEQSEPKKIAIVECKNHFVGLVFDRTGEVFRPDPRNGEELQVESLVSSAGTRLVSGMLKLGDGTRVIQVLDPAGLIDSDHFQAQTGDQAGVRNLSAWKRKKGLRKQCISFHVGSAKCALAIQSIQEILKVDELEESALAKGHCLGRLNLRGKIVPVLDFASFLGQRSSLQSRTIESEDRRVVVMRLESGFCGLLVDSIDSIVSYFEEEFSVFPVFAKERLKLFAGCISRPDVEDVILLDHQALVADAEVGELVAAHIQLYSEREDSTTSSKKRGVRQTSITFRLQGLCAFGIKEVREIIDYPTTMVKPQGLAPFFDGVLNLRGDLLPIVNARQLYGLPASENTLSQKVMILNSEKGRVGFVVDSVEEIITYTEAQKTVLPDLVLKAEAPLMNEDVREASQVELDSNNKRAFLILNPEAITRRVHRPQAA